MARLDVDLQSIQEARVLIDEAYEAQKVLATYSQEQLDQIVCKMATEVSKYSEELAKLAWEETGFGKWEDKIIKNKFASEYLYNFIKDMKCVGVISEDKEMKTMDIGVPLGVVAALVPSTNPTSTAIYKSLIALKSGNSIVFSPHPKAFKCSSITLDILIKSAEAAGAPKGSIGYLRTLTMEGTQSIMSNEKTKLVLATGGPGMVRAAYHSGTPAISGGPGNGPAFIERSANVKKAVKDIITSKTFDNGVICASEESVVVEEVIAKQVRDEFIKNKAYFLNEEESRKLSKFFLRDNGTINPAIVGKNAFYIASKAGFTVPRDTTVLLSEQDSVGRNNPYSREKLCPVLEFYVERDWHYACERCIELLINEGQGHTLVIHSNNEEVIREFARKKPVFRVLVNTPSAIGGIGATTNLFPALTLGCGALGGGSASDNISPLNLINVRRVGYGVRDLSYFRDEKEEVSNQCVQDNCNNSAAEALKNLDEETLKLVLARLLQEVK